jgi:ABC-type glycerol-3-phosphate transport system substrate-binding protein
MKKPSILALAASASLLALAACGGGDTPAAKSMTVRQQDTSKKAGAPKADTGTMKQMDENAAPKSGAKKP